jgi:hypothetical protein
MVRSYAVGICQLCGYRLEGVGVLCDLCWCGRTSRDVPHYLREPLAQRLERLERFERTGRPTAVPHRWHAMRR